jgi:hypothetical protein
MATSGGTQDQDTADILCGICESQHITKCADHWCPMSHRRKYLEVKDIAVTCPTYVNI